MLGPTKHSHPDKTIVNVALLLLARLKKQRVEEFDALLKLVKKKVKGGEFLFLPALSFLYVLGLIDYRPKNDSIEYLGPNEII